MIPLVQYLNDRDDDSGFQSFAPKRGIAGREPSAFRAIAGEGERPRATREARTDEDFEFDTAALFKELESELKSRAEQGPVRHDARALQDDLRERTKEFPTHRPASEEELKAAYEKGRTEAIAEAKAERDAAVEVAIENERRSAEEARSAAIEAARAEWTQAEGALLASGLAEQTDRLGTALRTTLSSILRPLAIRTRERQTINDIVDSIGTLALDGKAIGLTVSGSADLLSRIEDALGDKAGSVVFEPSETSGEVKVVVGQTVLQTRLGEWRAALETALS